jgi:hypothetical protein
MSTAFLRTMFSSSSPTPTANTWNIASFGGNSIGLVYPTSVAYGNSTYVAVGVGGYSGSNYQYPDFFTTKPIKYTTNFSLNWSDTTTNLDYINFTRVRFLNSKFLALGFSNSGTAYVCESTDGNTWIQNTIYTGASSSNFPVDIAWNGTHYVVGVSGLALVYRSSNLTSWTSYALASTNFIRTITYAAGLFVAPTNGYYAWTSPDGVTWTIRTISLASGGGGGWNSIIYANSKFVACGLSDFAVSSDGITWAIYAKASSTWFYDITYAYGKYIAVGGTISSSTGFINTSSDGITWSNQTITNGSIVLTGTTFDGTNIFSIGGYSVYVTSTNATTWTGVQNTPGYLRSAAVGTNASFVGIGSTMFVAGGDPLVVGQNATVLYSYDGLSWGKGTITGVTFNQNQQPIWAIVYSNGEFITNTGLRSTDGINWVTTSSYINTAACLITTPTTNLLYASRGFFNGTSNANIYKSTNNGVTWSVDYTNGSSNVGQMAYGAGRIIAISPSTNQVLVNPNLGVGWYSYSLPVNSGTNIVYANGQFYILSGTTSYRSVDGTSWTAGVITLSTGSIGSGSNRLFYKNGLYILNISSSGGINGGIYTSTNGVNYTLRYTLPSNQDNFGNSGTYNISSNPNTFVTFTNNTSASSKAIYYSTS